MILRTTGPNRKAQRFLTGSSRVCLDLKTFLRESSKKDPETTVYRGTMFELQTLEAFQELGMRLHHVGGRSDKGVDLRGDWPLKRLTATLSNTHVIAQCKNLKMGCTPDHMRALIGTIVTDSAAAGKDVLGILATVSHRQFTSDVLAYFTGSQVALGLAKIEGTQVQSLMFNEAAKSILQGLAITVRYSSDGKAMPVLTYNGEILNIEVNQ
ncbi:hypothetical protein DFQ28_007704 [Apophysomyces sp. BC1034]|nr:hypothetical protein DFQ30_009418 [Apophysomyces sp. BC1015]KAG0186500.1 hypothetical protein DFQ28_007704 [Apophysomyces sp. BC1034]